MRDEILGRLGRTAFERGLEADVVEPEAGTHASQAETGWPWNAATESAAGRVPAQPAGRFQGRDAARGGPGGWPARLDLGYVAQGLEETERRAWYMRREGDHYLFRTRARSTSGTRNGWPSCSPAKVRESLDDWIKEVYSGFTAFQVIPFPADHTAIPDNPDASGWP